MKTNPQVAIMMPVYNGEKTLSLAIKSLEVQTYKNWKCYIVNDGSTDRTKEILDSLNDPRFVVIHFTENKGRPYARQAILDVAEGDYLVFLDADDFFHPQKIEKQVKILEDNPNLKLVSCGNACYDSSKNLKTYRGLSENGLKVFINQLIPQVALRTSLIYLEEAQKHAFNKKLKFAQDTDFLIKVVNKGEYAVQDEILYYYSEFDSVTKYKILRTNFYGFLIYIEHFKLAPIFFSKKIIYNIGKILIKSIFYPFWSAEKMIQKRGKPVSKEMAEEYNRILKVIGVASV